MNHNSMVVGIPGSLRNFLGGSLCLMVSIVLFIAAGYKENPVFWTNAGGMPVWLKDGILFGFFPLWALLFFMNAVAVAHLLRRARLGRPVLAAIMMTFLSMVMHFITTVKVVLT